MLMKEFILLSLLFRFGFAQPEKNLIEEYLHQKRIGNFYLESNKFCQLDKKIKAAVCGVVFRFLNNMPEYKNQNKLLRVFYVGFNEETVSCKRQSIDINTDEDQPMMTCHGCHVPVRGTVYLDYYYDEIHISQGFYKNTIMVYKKVRSVIPQYDSVWPIYHMFLDWKNLLPAYEELFHSYPNTLSYAYNIDAAEVQFIYFREMIVDPLPNASMDAIQTNRVSVLRLFEICSHIIQNTYLRFVIRIQKKHFRNELVPLISKVVIKKYQEYLETNSTEERYLYHIPNGNSSSNNFRVSSGSRFSSLFFYGLIDKEKGEGGLNVFTPILMVENVELRENNVNDSMESNWNDDDNDNGDGDDENHSPSSTF